MTDEIKRPNYFTSQFLVESDFNTEQSYQVQARRRHNRVSHTFGVADSPGGNSLSVTFSTNTPFPTVIVGVGTAIDKDGNEIVFTDPVTYQLKTHPNSGNVLLFVSYQDVPTDPYTPAPEHFTRTTERPSIQDVNATTPPATDGSVILLARISLNVNAQIVSQASIDTTVRTYSSAKLGPGVVTGGTNGAANNASSGTATGNLAIGTIQGGWVGANASSGNIANGTITGNNTPNATAGTGNIAVGTITGGNNAGGVATGNLAIGTITGGTTATSGASNGTAAGNLAIGTIRGGQVGTTPAGIVGNIAFGTITGGTNGTANTASSGTATGNLAIGTIQGGWVGANASSGNIANGTITGNNTPNATAGTGNIALGTITGGNNTSGVATGNIAIGTITGGTTATSGASNGTAAGNLAIGTIRGGQVGTTPAGIVGNIAFGTITGGTDGTNATGNIAINTIVGGTNGNIVASSITKNELASASVDATKFVTVLSQATDISGLITITSGTSATQNFSFSDLHTAPKHYHMIMSLVVNPNGNNGNGPAVVTWRERATYNGNGGTHLRGFEVILVSGTAPVEVQYKIILLAM